MAEATRAEPLFGSLTKFGLSSVGSKVLMAFTGVGLWLFITGHLAGNLLAYAGHDAFNAYAAGLHDKPALVWFVRICLLVGFPVHIFTAARTAMLNGAARPVAYAYANKSPARMAAKSMMISGAFVLVFFAYHLSHFTLQITGPMPNPPDAYQMLVLGFSQPVIALFYIVAQVLLAGHLSHGLYSMFQHLGLWGRAWTPWVKNAALVIGYGMCAAFASIPLSVLFGLIKP